MWADNIDNKEVIIDEATQHLLEMVEPEDRIYKISVMAEKFVMDNADWYEGTPEYGEVVASTTAVFYEVFIGQKG